VSTASSRSEPELHIVAAATAALPWLSASLSGTRWLRVSLFAVLGWTLGGREKGYINTRRFARGGERRGEGPVGGCRVEPTCMNSL
jgi:hypothetical protein